MNPEPIIPFPSVSRSRGPRKPVRVTARKFTLETGHKLPSNWHRPGSLQYQFHCIIESMSVATGSPEDQSFLVQTHADVNYCFRVANNLKYKIRTVKQDGAGIRIWRIK